MRTISLSLLITLFCSTAFSGVRFNMEASTNPSNNEFESSPVSVGLDIKNRGGGVGDVLEIRFAGNTGTVKLLVKHNVAQAKGYTLGQLKAELLNAMAAGDTIATTFKVVRAEKTQIGDAYMVENFNTISTVYVPGPVDCRNN